MALYLGREKIKITASGTIKPTLQEKTVAPTMSLQSITPDNGYYGLSKVTVEGDDNLVADNIKSGVSIFGVNGTYEGSGGGSGGSAETCTVTIIGFELDESQLLYSIVYTDVNSAHMVKTLNELNPVLIDDPFSPFAGVAYDINGTIEVQVGSLLCSDISFQGSEGEITMLNHNTAEIHGDATIFL